MRQRFGIGLQRIHFCQVFRFKQILGCGGFDDYIQVIGAIQMTVDNLVGLVDTLAGIESLDTIFIHLQLAGGVNARRAQQYANQEGGFCM